jgi:hypothetical protein
VHKYTKEHVDFIKTNVVGRSYKELIELFYKRFQIELTFSQIKNFMAIRKLRNGRTGKFEKGHVPMNKGIKGMGGWEPTQFKPGRIPHNYKALGSERINGDGYVDVKVAEPNKWKGKHIVIWENHNGAIPSGHVVIFGDKNNRNFSINNLLLVTRQQLLVLNKKKIIKENADLTRVGIGIADVLIKIYEKSRRLTK